MISSRSDDVLGGLCEEFDWIEHELAGRLSTGVGETLERFRWKRLGVKEFRRTHSDGGVDIEEAECTFRANGDDVLGRVEGAEGLLIVLLEYIEDNELRKLGGNPPAPPLS